MYIHNTYIYSLLSLYTSKESRDRSGKRRLYMHSTVGFECKEATVWYDYIQGQLHLYCMSSGQTYDCVWLLQSAFLVIRDCSCEGPHQTIQVLPMRSHLFCAPKSTNCAGFIIVPSTCPSLWYNELRERQFETYCKSIRGWWKKSPYPRLMTISSVDDKKRTPKTMRVAPNTA